MTNKKVIERGRKGLGQNALDDRYQQGKREEGKR